MFKRLGEKEMSIARKLKIREDLTFPCIFHSKRFNSKTKGEKSTTSVYYMTSYDCSRYINRHLEYLDFTYFIVFQVYEQFLGIFRFYRFNMDEK